MLFNIGEILKYRAAQAELFDNNMGCRSTISNRVFESTIVLNNQGQGGISESMTSGFVVSSAGRIVVDTFPGGGVISHVIIRGYLMTTTS